jgi:hypothetical protein
VAPLWTLLESKGVVLNFAYQPFGWQSDSRNRAHVHVVIIGFSVSQSGNKTIYACNQDGRTCYRTTVKNINAYLIDGPNVYIRSRSQTISDSPKISKGNQPSDGGNLILSEIEKDALLKSDPNAKKFIRTFIGAEEFINGRKRYCLWLKDATPDEMRKSEEIFTRIRKVKEFRLKSSAKPTREKAATPHLFFFAPQPNNSYLVIPEVSSEKRIYVPIGFMSKDIIASNKLWIIPEAKLYHFGIMTSLMHMDWMRTVAGRLESRYQYSGSVVYNNFPWPKLSETQQKDITELSEKILQARAEHLPPKGKATLADLYDPLTMPVDLLKAHQKLDAAVDKAYRKEPFKSAGERVEYLFKLHSEITEPMNALAAQKPKRKAKAKK